MKAKGVRIIGKKATFSHIEYFWAVKKRIETFPLDSSGWKSVARAVASLIVFIFTISSKNPLFTHYLLFSTLKIPLQFTSATQLCPTLWSHWLQHARLPCPPPTPRAYSNSCPLSRWCHPTISSLVIPFFSCPQSFPASGSFPMSQFFTSGGQKVEFQLQHQTF